MLYTFGLAIHTIIALFFCFHAFRTHQDTYWIYILLAFPVLGSIIYFIAIYRHDLHSNEAFNKTAKGITKLIDPQKELKEASKQYGYAATPENLERLAQAYMAVGEPLNAAKVYIECLENPLNDRVKITLCAANALFEAGRFDHALSYLQSIEAKEAGLMAESYAVLAAKCLSAMNQFSDAEALYRKACEAYHSININIEFLLWGYQMKRHDIIDGQEAKVQGMMNNWQPQHFKHAENKKLLRRLKTARTQFKSNH